MTCGGRRGARRSSGWRPGPREPAPGAPGPSHFSTTIVYTVFVHNITLTADRDLIERARLVARDRGGTLNLAFRQWLAEYTAGSGDAQAYDSLMQRLSHVNSGRRFTRDEMNER